MWKVPQSNQIFGEIHILDTPFGRIINTLYEAGGVIGYSSRAGGALHQRKDYIEVDEINIILLHLMLFHFRLYSQLVQTR